MTLNYSAAHSSRVTKRTSKPPQLRRSVTSPFTTFNQRKPIQRSKSKPESSAQDEEDFFGERLDDLGLVTTLATDLSLRDVAQIVQYANGHMFDPLPERGGWNSTRISEILNFRRSLPAAVTLTHVHGLSKSPTAAEREISEMIKANVLRKIVIPGRGNGGSSVGEALILWTDLEGMLERSDIVDDALKGKTCLFQFYREAHYFRLFTLAHPQKVIFLSTKRELELIYLTDKFLATLRAQPLASNISLAAIPSTQVSNLKRAGFLTSNIQPLNSDLRTTTPETTTSVQLSTSISTVSKAPSGSPAAIGGEGAVVEAGITPSLHRGNSHLNPSSLSHSSSHLHLSLPNMGPYLRLLTSARSHLLSLIQKSRFRELPLYLLRERWDGGISDSKDFVSQAKRSRGEFAGVLPSRTKKWKHFYGLNFDWVLAECVGAGMIELFETGSVGKAVRIVT